MSFSFQPYGRLHAGIGADLERIESCNSCGENPISRESLKMKTRGRSGEIPGGKQGFLAGIPERFQGDFQRYSRGVVAGISARKKEGKKELNPGLFREIQEGILAGVQRREKEVFLLEFQRGK